MDRQEIARLICKTLGLVFAAIAVVYFWASLGTVFEFLRASNPFDFQPTNYGMLWYVGMPLAAYLSVAAVFWFGADWIGSRMASHDPSPVTSLTISTAELTTIVFGACGIFILVDGLVEMTNIVASYMYYRLGPDRLSYDGSIADFLAASAYYDISIWESLIRVAAGLWLIMGSRSVVGIFRRMRVWGLSARDQTNDSEDPS